MWYSITVLKIKTICHACDLWKIGSVLSTVAFTMPARPMIVTKFCLTQQFSKLPVISYCLILISICGLWCQRQVSQAGISNCIPQYSVGCNYLFLPEIPVSGAKVLISCIMSRHCRVLQFNDEFLISKWCSLTIILSVILDSIIGSTEYYLNSLISINPLPPW